MGGNRGAHLDSDTCCGSFGGMLASQSNAQADLTIWRNSYWFVEPKPVIPLERDCTQVNDPSATRFVIVLDEDKASLLMPWAKSGPEWKRGIPATHHKDDKRPLTAPMLQSIQNVNGKMILKKGQT